MAKTAARFSKRAQNSGLGQIFDEVVLQTKDQRKQITGSELDFIESPQGLGMRLYPVQQLIVKLTFGIPVDYKPMMVKVYDKLKEKLLYTLTQDQFLRMLHDQNRGNVKDWRDVPSWGFGTSLLVAGRRGGKSEVVGSIAGATLHNLLSIFNPQEHYGLAAGSVIDCVFLGTDEKSSGRLYEKLKSQVVGCSFFTPYLRSDPGTTSMQFVAEADRHRLSISSSINVESFPCTTRAVRGPSAILLAFDEFAHFRPSKDANSDDMFEDANASTTMFPNKEDPDRADSRTIVISSPVSKIGKFYELHKLALDGGIASNILTMRVSTAEMNPRIPASKLREAHKKDPVKFEMEYAACFSDGAGSYVPPEKFNVLIDPQRENSTRFDIKAVGRKFFWGFDSAMKKDASALAIGHLELVEGSGIHLVYDYIDRMMCGEAFTGPGVLNGERVAFLTELDLRDVVSWLVYMHNYLPCFKGVTDQHGGVTLKQLLQLNGITTMDLVHLTDQINSKMYNALQGYIFNGAASFPNVPKFATEFNALVAEYKSKYVLRVEAPKEKGAHDDMADATALVAWQAQTWLDEFGQLDLDPSAQILQVDPRIANPCCLVNPNDVSMTELRLMARMGLMGTAAMLPPNLPVLPSQRRWGMRGRR